MVIYVPIVRGCLSLFYKNYIVYKHPIPWSLQISISTQSFVSQLCPVIEIRESKLKKKKKKKKKKNNNNNNKMKNCENRTFSNLTTFLWSNFGKFFEDPHGYPFVKTD